MAKKDTSASRKKSGRGRKSKEVDEEKSWDSSFIDTGLKRETKRSIYAVMAFVLAFFFVLAAFGSGGVTGSVLYTLFTKLFGVGYFLLPVVLILLGLSYTSTEKPNIGFLHAISATLLFLSGLGIIDVISGTHAAGYIGEGVAYPFMRLFDVYVSMLFLLALLFISVLILFDIQPRLKDVIAWVQRKFQKQESEDGEEDTDTYEEVEVSAPEPEPVPVSEPKAQPLKLSKDEEEDFPIVKDRKKGSSYTPPPISLLENDKGKPNVGDIKANSNIIKRTLHNFGILVEMDEVTIGPTVTRYALKPAEGVKLSRIVGLQNDLALALAAHSIRIEAPIPGKSLVGIEVPNKSKSTVGLGTLLSDDKFQKGPEPLLVALGRGLSGKSKFSNLGKMPHLLIAGTTGSGKSVTIHSIITSLLYRNGPDEMRFIMIDPKRVELTLYNKIPHLLTPVITDPKKAILALKWAAKEMDRRYDILEAESVRDISSYHNNIVKPAADKKAKDDEENKVEPMPYIVIIIDELADIMQTYPRELEAAIVRLAQMSRAVGIHLILSTQRPSVNVITGLIKANVPARLALQVSSQIDSRTILDTGGAEKLLGAGDMLFLSGEMSQPERVQSAFISEEEVKKVVKYLAEAFKDELINDIELSAGTISPDKSIFESTLEDSDDDDELYEEARMIVIEAGKASTSYLQRKLKVGYARAARLMDMLEERGIIGPSDGAKPREILEKSVPEERESFE